jgi:hypothetical protein
MDQHDLELIAREVGSSVREYVQIALEPLQRRIAELETRERNFGYSGVWQAAGRYCRGNFVSHDGSMWHANCDTSAKPGTSSDWSLAVKRGKDAA